MTLAVLAPTLYQQFWNANATAPAAGYKLFTYQAGTSTKQPTYLTSFLDPSNQNTNPIILDAAGTANLWLDPALIYKFVLALPNDTDPPTGSIRTIDNVYPTLTSQSLPSFGYVQTPAEATAGVVPSNTLYPPGNMLRYGLVPNVTAAAANNTAILRLLWNLTNGVNGNFTFPNTTGADIYYFNAPIPVCYNVYIEGQGVTSDLAYTATAGDTNSGLFMFLSDCSLKNMTITTEVNTSAATGSGHAIFEGGRGIDNTYFTIWDSLLPRSLGRNVFQNITIRTNNTGTNLASSGGMEMIGGIRDSRYESISINLNGTAPYGMIYEFGWATNEAATKDRQTSHMHNCSFRNIDVVNCGSQDGGSGAGLYLGGAYNCFVENLYVNNAPVAFTYTPGEAAFYRPWVGVDDVGAKRNITLRNVVGEAITGTGLALTGSLPGYAGYLASTIAALGHPADYAALTDLMHFSVDGFAINAAGFGISVSGSNTIANGKAIGVAASGQLVIDDECMRSVVTNCSFLNSSFQGVRMSLSDAVWSPARLKFLTIEGCKIAGNAGSGIVVSNSRSVIIRNCQLGFSTLYDVAAETVQINSIVVAGPSGGGGVIAESNFCTPVTGSGGVSYAQTGTPTACEIRNPKGSFTLSGIWSVDGTVYSADAGFTTATSVVNTTPDKFPGKLGYNSTTKKLYAAQGINPADTWIAVGDGSTTITPS